MRNFLFFCFFALFPSLAAAQSLGVVKGNCTPDAVDDGSTLTTRATRALRLPSVKNKWDSTRVYRQAVILIEFSDTDFSLDHPRETYDSMFNYPGFNKREGLGCVAEYFREQSGGMFNVAFDVYGPVKVSKKSQPYANPTENTRNYSRDVLIEATEFVVDSLKVDFTPYDWSGNGKVDQVIYVCAGITGNQDNKASYGHIWPNTSTFSTVNANGKRISNYTASAEKWVNGESCGIGTIIHEYTHSMGLPDIYPQSSNAGYSVVDEWDLMDGGNFTNYGWCPPNYTPTEKMLLGWLKPVELTEPQTVRGVKPVSDGGKVYRIMHSSNEWLIMEARQQKGWDKGLPGEGLVVYHVYYDDSAWSGNSVNNDPDHRRFELIHADNMDYDDWVTYINTWAKPKNYANSGHMNSYVLRSSAYPWTTDSTSVVNDSLTNTSVPPAKMNYPNNEGSIMLSKSITNIVKHADGTYSFDFMADVAKCATPTVVYEDGRIRFECDTEGATFVSSVDTNTQQPTPNAHGGYDLATQYVITVYATAQGHADSDVVTATLTWSDGVVTGENVEVRGGGFRKGDVNEDGSVDVADISNIITIMANE